MKANFKFVISMLALVMALSLSAFGQETTGSIEVTVRDTAGAVVPNASGKLPVTARDLINYLGDKFGLYDGKP